MVALHGCRIFKFHFVVIACDHPFHEALGRCYSVWLYVKDRSERSHHGVVLVGERKSLVSAQSQKIEEMYRLQYIAYNASDK